jgi:hypothetical protein
MRRYRGGDQGPHNPTYDEAKYSSEQGTIEHVIDGEHLAASSVCKSQGVGG